MSSYFLFYFIHLWHGALEFAGNYAKSYIYQYHTFDFRSGVFYKEGRFRAYKSNQIEYMKRTRTYKEEGIE